MARTEPRPPWGFGPLFAALYLTGRIGQASATIAVASVGIGGSKGDRRSPYDHVALTLRLWDPDAVRPGRGHARGVARGRRARPALRPGPLSGPHRSR